MSSLSGARQPTERMNLMKPQKRNTKTIRQCCSCRLWKQESEFEPFKDTVTSACLVCRGSYANLGKSPLLSDDGERHLIHQGYQMRQTEFRDMAARLGLAVRENYTPSEGIPDAAFFVLAAGLLEAGWNMPWLEDAS